MAYEAAPYPTRSNRLQFTSKDSAMRSIALLLCACSVVAAFAGCGGSQTANREVRGGLAVVDLDVVAEKLGRDHEMTAAFQQAQRTLKQELVTLQERLKDGLKKQKDE